MKIAKTIFFLVFLNNMFAQDATSTTTSTKNFRTDTFTGKVSATGTGFWVPAKNVNNDITGSVYLFDNWIGNFNIFDSSDNKFLVTNLNYNIKTNTLESKVSNDSVFQFDLGNIKKVSFGNKKYEVVDGKLVESLFNSDKLNIYKEFTVKVIEATLNPMTQENITDRKYVKKSKFLVKKNDLVQELKLNKKNVLSLFEKNQNDVKKFVKDNNLNYSDENDLFKILKKFNS
jgi:hypothetical protein